MRSRVARGCGCAAALVLALAGCSAQANQAVTITGTTLTVYASRPPGNAGGQVDADVLAAEQLALHVVGNRAGRFTIQLLALHGAKLSDNARTAIQDQSAVAYLGELTPGTSQNTVPITNELGLLQVSPTDTAAYLTQAVPAVSGSPGTFYPSNSSYHQTFARVVPTTGQEAQAVVGEMRSLGLDRLYVADDGGPYGATIAQEVRQAAASHALTLAGSAAGAGAVFYGGNDPVTAARALDQAAAAAPGAKLFAPSALYDDGFVAALSAAAQQRLYVSSPGFSAASLSAAGRAFQATFTAAYGHRPAPQAIFGYEAMAAVIAVLREAGANAASRATVVGDFRALRDRNSVLGTYSIRGGDITIAPFIFARPRGGTLVPISG